MSTETNPVSRPMLLRFCDGFLQDRNIKWMLMAGMLILLGSSLLLVSAHWDTYTPVWKYGIFLAYTAAIFGVGQWTRSRMAVPLTATVLQALTVLLVPITFVVLHWVQREQAGHISQEVHLVLGTLNLVFALAAARAIFHHFLRSNQPTFLVSYLLLALAGAVVPGLPEAWAPVVVLALWAVFAAGSVKVNRHVFWLTEEQRAPRIFGFFPIMLLGAQFLMVFALYAPASITLDWLGLGAVLVAIPVLCTADAVAWVHEQRTGNLVRPLPWVIIGPLALGIALCAAGVILAGTSILPPQRPHALALAAGLAAFLMAVTARRTGNRAFVWSMLAGVVVAYNFSPVFFADMARAILDQGAQLVHEERLPYAFYGLTYIPLLLLVTVVAWFQKRAGNALFAGPLQAFAVGLACLMVALAFGHVKALVPVALAIALVFSLQRALFQDGRLAYLAASSWLIAAGGFAAFAQDVLNWSVPGNPEIFFLTAGAGVLLIAGLLLDRLNSRSLPTTPDHGLGAMLANVWAKPCQATSLVVTFGLCAFWLATQFASPLDSGDWPMAALLMALLLAQVVRWSKWEALRLPLLLLVNVQALVLTAHLLGPTGAMLFELGKQDCTALYLPLTLVAAISLFAWQLGNKASPGPWSEALGLHRLGLRMVAIMALGGSVQRQADLAPAHVLMAAAAFGVVAAGELLTACRRQSEARVWTAAGVVLAACAYLAFFHILVFGQGIAMFALLGLGLVLWFVGECVGSRVGPAILQRPFQHMALALPMASVAVGVYRHAFTPPVWLGANSLALLLAAGFYFWRGLERSSKAMLILAGVILNLAMMLLWHELAWNDPQFFMIPIGISLLALVQLLKAEVPDRFHDPLRYLGALVILVSPTFHIVGGSWLHLFSLMVVSVGVMLVAMGLRVRALIYTGTAFLIADLVAMVVRGSIDDPNVLWMAGLALGAGVIALGAVCERHREALVGRVRVLTETLKQWN